MDLAKRGLTDMQGYVAWLEKKNHLIRVKSPVDAVLELAGIAKKFEGGKAVLFENVKGSDYPVLIGLYWNRPIIAGMYGTTSERLPFVLSDEIGAWRKEQIEPIVVDSGPANEVIESDPDINTLPIPHHSEGDGGRYITAAVVIAKDPDTGVRNLSIHRMMVTGPKRFTLLLEELGHVMDYYKRAEAKGQPLEITVNNGADLGSFLAAASPAAAAPIEMDEIGIACQIMGQPIHLIKAQTVGVEALADAQFVIEGRILPNVREEEGPYAEVTVYYANREPRWVLEVTAITRRRTPIWHTLLSGLEVRQAYASVAEAGVFERIRFAVPQVTAVHFLDGSVPYHLAVQIDKQEEGQQHEAIKAAFAANAFFKTITVVDTDVDIFNLNEIEWAWQTRARFDKDIALDNDGIGHRLNPMVEDDKWTRMGVDATVPFAARRKIRKGHGDGCGPLRLRDRRTVRLRSKHLSGRAWSKKKRRPEAPQNHY